MKTEWRIIEKSGNQIRRQLWLKLDCGTWIPTNKYMLDIRGGGFNLDPTIDKAVVTSTDDGFTRADPQYFSSSTTLLNVGNWTLPYSFEDAWYRFRAIALPLDAVIDVAYIAISIVYCTPDVNTRIYADDQANPSAPSNYEDHRGRTRTSNSVEWVIDEQTGLLIQSPSLVSVIQELADSYDYTLGGAIQILHDHNDETGDNQGMRVRAYDLSPDYVPQLHIEYTGEEPPPPPPPTEYVVSPLQGPQALYVPEAGKAYITADTGTERKLIRWSDGSFATPYSTSGSPLEVTGPWSNPSLIYLFGNPTPVLLRSPDGGDTQTDIKPGNDPLRPVLPLPWREDDLLVVSSAGSVHHRDVNQWIEKGVAPIEPECGMRSRYGGVQILLGQKQAGEANKVAFSGNLAESWQDMSDGLPDMKVTSIAGLEGTGTLPRPRKKKYYPCANYVEQFDGELYDYYWQRHWWPQAYWHDYFAGVHDQLAYAGTPYPYDIEIDSWGVYYCLRIEGKIKFRVRIILHCPQFDLVTGYIGAPRPPTFHFKSAATRDGLDYQQSATLENSQVIDYGNRWYAVETWGLIEIPDSEPWVQFSFMIIEDEPWEHASVDLDGECGVSSNYFYDGRMIVFGEYGFPRNFGTQLAEFLYWKPDAIGHIEDGSLRGPCYHNNSVCRGWKFENGYAWEDFPEKYDMQFGILHFDFG